MIPSGGVAGVANAGSITDSQLISNLAELDPGTSATNITHYNIKPTFDILAGNRNTDLGSVADAVQKIVADHRKNLPRGTQITIRGQVQSMHDSFTGLSYGLIFAVVLVYLLMVINFQSWLDPLIILMKALPAGVVRNFVDVVCHRHDDFRPIANGCNHEHRRGNGQQHSAHHLRQRSKPALRKGKTPMHAALSSGHHPASAGHHDRHGDDHRHAAHVSRPR